MNFCSQCGAPVEKKIPPGDLLPRYVCTQCEAIHYRNPLVVMGCIPQWQERVLLCRRAIEPRKGYWTLPAGYLELHESAVEGAEREAWEEARAKLDIDQLMAVYSIPRISQIQLIYRARLRSPEVAPGPETMETGLFDWADVPWAEIAFPSVHWALNDHRALRGQTIFAPRSNPPGERGDVIER